MMRWVLFEAPPLGLKFWLGHYFKAVSLPYLLFIGRFLKLLYVFWCGFINRMIQEEGLYVYKMHDKVHFSINIALVRSRGGSQVYHKGLCPNRTLISWWWWWWTKLDHIFIHTVLSHQHSQASKLLMKLFVSRCFWLELVALWYCIWLK
jgi:hypothetical protein